jgi:hypothetical protein
MQLPQPITMSLVRFDGVTREQTFAELPVSLFDCERLKRVQAQLPPFMKTLTLWEGEAYDAAGDYTQAQVEARVLSLLGPDIKAGLEKLFVPPARPVR